MKRYNRITNITRAYVYIYAGASREALILIVYSAFSRVYRSGFYHLFVQIDDQLAANRSSMNKRNESGENKEDIKLLRLVEIRSILECWYRCYYSLGVVWKQSMKTKTFPK